MVSYYNNNSSRESFKRKIKFSEDTFRSFVITPIYREKKLDK